MCNFGRSRAFLPFVCYSFYILKNIIIEEDKKKLSKSNQQKGNTKKTTSIYLNIKEYFNERIEVCDNRLSTPFCNFEKATKERLIFSLCLEKLEELEGSDSNE